MQEHKEHHLVLAVWLILVDLVLPTLVVVAAVAAVVQVEWAVADMVVQVDQVLSSFDTKLHQAIQLFSTIQLIGLLHLVQYLSIISSLVVVAVAVLGLVAVVALVDSALELHIQSLLEILTQLQLVLVELVGV
jgi:hypothetical protein